MNKNKQIALITGASSGIGAEIAIQLASKNIHTIIITILKDKVKSYFQKVSL